MRDIVIAIITSGLLSTIITIISNKFTQKDNVEKAVMQLLGMEIRKRCEKAISDDCITLEGLRQVQDMNILYRQMNGNGYVRTLMGKVEQLKIKEEE